MRRRPLTGSLSLLLLKPLNQRLIMVTSFRLSKLLCSRPVLFKRAVNFGSVFPNSLDRGIYDTKFLIPVSFLFTFCICCITLTFPSTLINLPFIRDCSHVMTLAVFC
jgi:hypothetical protein